MYCMYAYVLSILTSSLKIQTVLFPMVANFFCNYRPLLLTTGKKFAGEGEAGVLGKGGKLVC